MVRTLEDIGWITGHITLIWNELYSAWKLGNQDRHGKEEELQRHIRLGQVKRQIQVLYHLQPLCNLTNHRKWFYANPEEHFLREPLLTQFQNWVTTFWLGAQNLASSGAGIVASDFFMSFLSR
jgi:hypothetical protein